MLVPFFVHRESQCSAVQLFLFLQSPYKPDCSFFCCCCGAPTADRGDVTKDSLSEEAGLERFGQSEVMERSVTNPRDPPPSLLLLRKAGTGHDWAKVFWKQ